jgi:hypothetical protein
MHHQKWLHLGLVLAAIGFVSPLAARAQTKSLLSRQDNQGQVMVSVTPMGLPDSDTWRFAVRLNTHVAPITQDLATVSVLSDGKGHEVKPMAWQGDPPGGHHRKGVLLFKPIRPRPDAITLKIRQIGSVPERTFTWQLNGR